MDRVEPRRTVVLPCPNSVAEMRRALDVLRQSGGGLCAIVGLRADGQLHQMFVTVPPRVTVQ